MSRMQKLKKVHTFDPDGLTIYERVGRGSNNKVYTAEDENGRECVLRAPRRRSDTQQRGSAEWEFVHTMRAAEIGAAPQVLGAWQARHARGSQWPSGLYLLTERYEYDLEKLFADQELRSTVPDFAAIGAAVADCLDRLAQDMLFVYDLKPSNIVVRYDDDGAIEARVIDFGRDFCEWGGADVEGVPDGASHPNIDMLRTLTEGDDERVQHILFAAMLVQLAATTTNHMFHDRRDTRMGSDERARTNPFPTLARTLIDGMQGGNRRLLRALLRTDSVRGVMRHYLGRRSSGTKRVLGAATGREF